MRISYAIILAAIAMFEGCKPKEAVAPNNDGGNNDAADQEAGDEGENEEGQGDNALGAGQDPKNLKPNPKQSSKEKLQKAHELVKTCKKKLGELETGKVALDKSFDAANTDFEKANADFESAKAAHGQVETMKTQLANALLGGPGSPGDSNFEYPIERNPTPDMRAHLKPIVDAVNSVPALGGDATARTAVLQAARESLEERRRGLDNPSNKPADWTVRMTEALEKLTQAVEAELAANADAIREAKGELVQAIYQIAYPRNVREKARELKVAINGRDGNVQALTRQLLEMDGVSESKVAIQFQRKSQEPDQIRHQIQVLRGQFVQAFRGEQGTIPADIWNAVRSALDRDGNADITPFLKRVLKAADRARREQGDDEPEDDSLATAADVARELKAQMEYAHKLPNAIERLRKELVGAILQEDGKGLSLAILEAADDDSVDSAKTLSDLIAEDRKQKSEAFAEETRRVREEIANARAERRIPATRFPQQVDLYALNKKLNRLVGPHKDLKALFDAPQKTQDMKAACLAAMDGIIPKPPADTLHDAINAYRVALSASPRVEDTVNDKRQRLIAAIERPENVPRRDGKAFIKYLYDQLVAARSAPSMGDVKALEAANTEKKAVLDAAQAKVTALDKEISTQRGVCKKAEEEVGKLINPE